MSPPAPSPTPLRTLLQGNRTPTFCSSQNTFLLNKRLPSLTLSIVDHVWETLFVTLSLKFEGEILWFYHAMRPLFQNFCTVIFLSYDFIKRRLVSFGKFFFNQSINQSINQGVNDLFCRPRSDTTNTYFCFQSLPPLFNLHVLLLLIRSF